MRNLKLLASAPSGTGDMAAESARDQKYLRLSLQNLNMALGVTDQSTFFFSIQTLLSSPPIVLHRLLDYGLLFNCISNRNHTSFFGHITSFNSTKRTTAVKIPFFLQIPFSKTHHPLLSRLLSAAGVSPNFLLRDFIQPSLPLARA